MSHVMANTSLPATVSSEANSAVPLERRCDNPDCTVYKMVLNVPKRKAPQFVTEPIVMEKPLLINGFTTIFQVEGQSAKLSDLKNTEIQKPLFRIVPNTHAHIVNYVVVDSDAESLRKINENDPATMRKLLDSQKQSADQMLKKLIAGHTVPLANLNSMNLNASTSSLSASSATANIAPSVASAVGVGGGGAVGPVTSSTPIAKIIPQQPSSSAIQLPTRVHPNLKITAVAGADGLALNELTNNVSKSSMISAASTSSSSSSLTQLPTLQQLQQPTLPAMPLITPVPLANLQRALPPPPAAITMPTHAPPVMPISNIGMPSSSATAPVEIPVFDKMQQELQELRRTVALLAEAQAKNKQN